MITGASSGIGATFARKLAARGWDLLLIARRDDRLQALARELSAAHGRRVLTLAADLTHSEVLESVALRIADTADLGLLINNAGFGTNGYFWEAEAHSQQQMRPGVVPKQSKKNIASKRSFTTWR